MLNNLLYPPLLTLLPILMLSVRPRRLRRIPTLPLGVDQEPSDAQLNALMREFLDDREPIHPTARRLVRYLAPEDAVTIKRCADAHMRWADPRAKRHELKPRLCRSFWCPWCIRRAHARRTRYQYLKLQSLQPQGDDRVRLFNLVAELPQPLHALTRNDPDTLKPWIGAIRQTLAHAYGYQSRKGANAARVAFGHLGAIFNFHAIGDEGTPYPKYFPHYDILLSAYRLHEGQMKRLPSSWPERFHTTRAHYRTALRKAFLPLAQHGPHKDATLAAFLKTDFDVYWHVGRPPKGAGQGHVHIRNAAHRIRYSCRPLFGLDCCRLEQDDNGNDILVYEPKAQGRKRIIHRVSPGPAFGALRSLKSQLAGKHARVHQGILNGKPYKRVCTLSGRNEVYEQPKQGRRLVGAYVRDNMGRWHNIDPRDLRRI